MQSLSMRSRCRCLYSSIHCFESGYHPGPFDIATCRYYTGVDPFTKQPVYVARNLHDRQLQRALMRFFKPENYFEVRKALEQAGRQDLIGSGCDALIPAHPPKEALKARMERTNRAFRGEYVHTVPNTDRLAATHRGAQPAKN